VAGAGSEIGYGWYPPSRWRAGEALRQRARVRVSQPGRYRLEVAAVAGGRRAVVHRGPLVVGATAAHEAARTAAARAAGLMARGNPEAAVGTLAFAVAATGDQGARAEVARARTAGARGLGSEASAALDAGPMGAYAPPALLRAVERARRLLPRDPLPSPWPSVAARAGAAADAADRRGDREAAYALALAAATADSGAAGRLRRLIAARRAAPARASERIRGAFSELPPLSAPMQPL
jgi:hypothetical protein